MYSQLHNTLIGGEIRFHGTAYVASSIDKPEEQTRRKDRPLK